MVGWGNSLQASCCSLLPQGTSTITGLAIIITKQALDSGTTELREGGLRIRIYAILKTNLKRHHGLIGLKFPGSLWKPPWVSPMDVPRSRWGRLGSLSWVFFQGLPRVPFQIFFAISPEKRKIITFASNGRAPR